MRDSNLAEQLHIAVGGAPQSLGGLVVTGRDAWLGGPLAVDDLAVGSIAAALLAGAELAEARGGERPAVEVSGEHAALSFRSEAHARIRGRPAGARFSPLSRFVRCAGGSWARTHGNYPHHAAALGRALGLEQQAAADRERVVAALERVADSLDAFALEDAVFAEGGCAAALRSPAQWNEAPAERAGSETPLVVFDDGAAPSSSHALSRPAGPTRPAEGIRVLDLTRVIAGPVAGRTLAALGAEVLRVDPPHLPELPAQHLDTGSGKRTAILDLADAERREPLLAGADVILTGYRPGALARFGLRPDQLSERHPQLVQVSLSAWGNAGPWAQRRGFDSLVQVATGIASECAAGDGSPGALPAQALDHATGHLVAAVALRGLARRTRGQPVPPAELALVRTAAALLRARRPERSATDATGSANPGPHRVSFGEVTLISPPGTLDGTALRWLHGPRPLGSDDPSWSAR